MSSRNRNLSKLVTSDVDLVSDVAELQNDITNLAAVEFFTATVTGSSGTSDWSQASAADPFVATLTVNGIKSTDRPIVDIDLSGVDFEDVGDVQNEWGEVYRVEASNDDELKLYALDEPFSTFNILIKVVR